MSKIISSGQKLIRDSGSEILAKRIIRRNIEKAVHTVQKAITRENYRYEIAVANLTGLYVSEVSKDEVPALEILAKKKAISKIKKLLPFPILCFLSIVAGSVWLPSLPDIYLLVIDFVMTLVIVSNGLLLGHIFKTCIFGILLHQRRLKKLKAKLKELEGGNQAIDIY